VCVAAAAGPTSASEPRSAPRSGRLLRPCI
jgi:hypothetical protein